MSQSKPPDMVIAMQQIETKWRWQDHWGQIKARFSSFRMDYKVAPGVYAIGKPGRQSEVLVTANYKLTFDILRRNLEGLDAWILVLDTHAINVWCAAGKGTFGTYELIKRIRIHELEKLVEHRRVIVPQLGAPGIAAGRVQRESGFRVWYGPVRAEDIRTYLERGRNATPEMRKVRFPMLDRLVLTPLEAIPATKTFLKYGLAALPILLLAPQGLLFQDLWSFGFPLFGLALMSLWTGAIAVPLFLPWIPFRSFGCKGWLAGLLTTVLGVLFLPQVFSTKPALAVFALILFPIISSFTALQFTGATPFTGISGVKKELKIAIPIFRTGAVISVIPFLMFKLKQWGVL